MSPSKQPESLTRKTLAGSAWSALSTVGRQLLSFASVAVLARVLGPAVYGLMGMTSLLTVFLLNFRDMGMSAAIIRDAGMPPRLLSALFWMNAAMGVVLTVVVMAVAGPFADFFHEPALVAVMRGVAPSFLIASLGIVHNALLTREMKFDSIARADMVAVLLSYATAVTMALSGGGVWSLVIANLVNSVVATACYWYFARWTPRLEWDGPGVRSVLGFSLNLTGFGFVNYFARNADNIVVGRALGSVSLGYYQMAYNLMLYPIQNISSVLSQVLLPAFSRMQDDDARFRAAYLRSSMLIGLITFPVMAGMAVVADPFVRVLLGVKWVPVIPVFQILAPVGLVQSVCSSCGQIYIVKGRTGRVFAVATYAAAICVVAFLIGVGYGMVGVAVAYAVAFLSLVLFPVLSLAFRLIDLSVWLYVRKLFPQFAITMVMVAVCLLWRWLLHATTGVSPNVDLFSTAAIGCIVYLGLMLRLRPEVMAELEVAIEHTDQIVIAEAYAKACSLVGRTWRPGVATPLSA